MQSASVYILVAIAILAIASVTTSLGVVYVALSRSEYRWAIPIVSLVMLPIVLIVSISWCGYLSAKQIDVSQWQIVVVLGVVTTLIILYKNWRDIAQISNTWISGVSLLSAIVGVIRFAYLNGTEKFAYNYLGNGEFLNYARLAFAVLHQEAPVTEFIEQHQNLRYGQDIFLAVLSHVLSRNPVELVHIASGYLLFTYGAVVGLIISRVFTSRLLVILLVILNSAIVLPLFNFNTSFFSSSVILPSALLVLAYSSSRSYWNRPHEFYQMFPKYLGTLGEGLFLVAFITFMAITYPEFGYPVMAASLSLACYQSLGMRRLSRPLVVFILSLSTTILINHDLLMSGIINFFNQLGSSGGWNIFGDPRVNFLSFFLNISGLRYAPAANHVNFPAVFNYFLLVAWTIFILLAFRQGKSRQDGIIIVLSLWIALSALVLLSPFLIGGHWYPAVKFFSQFSIGGILIIGLAFSDWITSPKAYIKWPASLLLISICIMYGIVTTREVQYAKGNVEVLALTEWKKGFDDKSRSVPFYVLKENDGEIVWFAELVALDLNVQLLPTSWSQAERLARGAIPNTQRLCGTESGHSINYDFSVFPGLGEEFVVLVGSSDPRGMLSTNSEFTIPVLTQETIANLGKIQLDRVTIDPKGIFQFPQTSWAVDGVWSACLPSRTTVVDVSIMVPSALIASGSVDIQLQYAGNTISQRVSKPGRYVITGKAASPSNVPRVISVRASKSWVPKEIDPQSLDVRRLAFSVASVGIH